MVERLPVLLALKRHGEELLGVNGEKGIVWERKKQNSKALGHGL